MSHPIPVLKRPLRELEDAIDKEDVPAQLRASGRLLELAGGLWAHKPPVDSRGVMAAEDGRGDRQQDCARLVAKLERVQAQYSALGLPWDGSLLKLILEFLMSLLAPIIRPPTP